MQILKEKKNEKKTLLIDSLNHLSKWFHIAAYLFRQCATNWHWIVVDLKGPWKHTVFWWTSENRKTLCKEKKNSLYSHITLHRCSWPDHFFDAFNRTLIWWLVHFAARKSPAINSPDLVMGSDSLTMLKIRTVCTRYHWTTSRCHSKMQPAFLTFSIRKSKWLNSNWFQSISRNTHEPEKKVNKTEKEMKKFSERLTLYTFFD